MKNVDPRMLFGFGLLIVVAALAAVIAIGHVHQESSFGLQYLLGSLSSLSGGFAQWAFSKDSHKGESNEKGIV